MQWVLLLPVAILFVMGSYLTYSYEYRTQWWYIPLGALVGLFISVIWYSILVRVGDAKQIYFFGMIWDSVAVVAYCFIPLFCFGVRLNYVEIVGLLCILIGLGLMKIGG